MTIYRERARRVGAYLDVATAMALNLIFQTAVESASARRVPNLAPDIAVSRGWNVTLVTAYPTILFATVPHPRSHADRRAGRNHSLVPIDQTTQKE